MGGAGHRAPFVLFVAVLTLAACSSGVRPKLPSPAAGPTGPADKPTNSLILPGGEPPAPDQAAALYNRILTQISAPGTGADLPLGPGDMVEVSVFEVEELSKLQFRIPLRGNITLPLIGQVPASGRTPLELEDDIRARLEKKFMHNPQVSVFVREHQSQRITIIGAVRTAGVQTITSRLRLADAFAMAQGLAEDAEQTVYLIRRLPPGSLRAAGAAPATQSDASPRAPGASAAPATPGVPGMSGASDEVMIGIDLEALAKGRQELNVDLQSGDIIYVPRGGSYYIGGSIEKGGPFVLKGKTTLQQAIVAAGGPKDVADWEDVRIYRTKSNSSEREVLVFNLHKFDKGEAAPEIQKNDVIIVGKSASKSFWYGAYDWFKSIFSVGVGYSKPL